VAGFLPRVGESMSADVTRIAGSETGEATGSTGSARLQACLASR
jgi:hypothetical protein